MNMAENGSAPSPFQHARGAAMLHDLAGQWSGHGPPIIVFNKSHSGSRALARLLAASGVFIGSDLNESEDAADILRLVEPMVERHYPDYARLMREGDPQLTDLVTSVFSRHLKHCPKGTRWGWKLCETLYIVPLLDRLFPGAIYLHLVRDGRDVAFSDHVAPELPFWRKVYFDTTAIERWQGRRLYHPDYRRAPHVFNARHWVNSVSVARHYGSMLGERYIEVRYEDLVCRPEATARRLLPALGLPADPEVIASFAAAADTSSVGKYRRQPERKQTEALEVLHPTLASFGYADPRAGARPGVLAHLFRR